MFDEWKINTWRIKQYHCYTSQLYITRGFLSIIAVIPTGLMSQRNQQCRGSSHKCWLQTMSYTITHDEVQIHAYACFSSNQVHRTESFLSSCEVKIFLVIYLLKFISRRCQFPNWIVFNGNLWTGSYFEGNNHGLIKVLFRHLPGGTEEINRKLVWPVSRSWFEPSLFWIKL